MPAKNGQFVRYERPTQYFRKLGLLATTPFQHAQTCKIDTPRLGMKQATVTKKQSMGAWRF